MLSAKKWFSFVLIAIVFAVSARAADPSFPSKAKRILFLGDSITHAGRYISLIDTQLRLRGHDVVLINLGLPSETCSGLSEPEHPYPRPNVHLRIDDALEKIRPDVVVACYGMNDGIYYPFSEERFQAYQDGINQIVSKVKATGAKLILMTPPAFDPLPLRKQGKLLPLGSKQYSWKAIYEDYDSVMKQYAKWILEQSDRVDMTIDLHSAVTDYVASKREDSPDFTMSPDGVHVNDEGHAVLAEAVLNAWGLGDRLEPDASLATLIDRRQKIMHDAWLSEVGHERPGMKAGLPIKEAKAVSAEIEKQIQARLIRQQDSSKPEYKDVHRCYFPASTVPGELSLFVDFDLWIPPGVEQLRGIIVHQHGCGAGASNAGLTAVCDLHWRELARRWNCALLGSSYEGRPGSECRLWCDPRKGSDARFLQALHQFADSTGHPELREVPWCLWGHSGGGFWASLMQISHPERIVAIWLQSGTAFGYWTSGDIEQPELVSSVYDVPVMACPGVKERKHERFHRAWDGLHGMMSAYRQQNAPFGIAPDPRTGHECGDSRYLAIPFFDACMRMRLPDAKSPTSDLQPVDWSQAWLGSVSGDVFAADQYPDDIQEASWLPNERFARQWAAFRNVGSVPDLSPPSAPHSLQVNQQSGRTVLTWQADADFESGLGGFRIEKDSKTVARLPAKPVSRYGRPIFQVMNYSGTPVQPLAAMRFVDEHKSESPTRLYRVFSVNAEGVESSPAVLQLGVPATD